MIKGFLVGLGIGSVVLLVSAIISFQCFSYNVSVAINPPWYCSDIIAFIIRIATFPISMFTDDLSRAAYFAPLTIIVYGLLGACAGKFVYNKT